jgi:hypothetical protein
VREEQEPFGVAPPNDVRDQRQGSLRSLVLTTTP